MACLDARLVTALFAGTLSRHDRDRIDDHVDDCAACRRWVATVARDHVGRESRIADPTVPPDVATDAETLAARDPDRVTLAPGAQVGRYVVRDFLGAGGMGVVYTAHDPQLDRIVALKVVRAGTGPIESARAARFVREAQAMARVSHPNVVPIFDAGEADGVVFIAMKRVEGASLRRYLATVRPARRHLLRLLCGAGRGLAAAHAAGIVHRDFKPDNVLIDADGTAQVADFGLAALTTGHGDEVAPTASAGDPWQTSAGTILGTPAYMAPEVRDGGRADALSDQYGFAVVVDEALGSAKPRRVERALGRALADEPSQRFASIDELVAVLERRPVAPWIAAAAAAVVAVAVVWIAWPATSDPAAACDAAADRRADEVRAASAPPVLAAHLASLPHLHPRDAATLVEGLDRRAADWLATRKQTCHARGELSAELYDLRMACLDERLDEVAVVRRSLAALDDRHADAAPRLVGVLGELDKCANPKGLRGAVAEAWARTLRARMFEAHVVLQQGDYDRALAVFEASLAEARAGHLDVIEAEALMARAVVLAQTRRPGAIEGFHQVRAIAERLGDPGLRADALNALLADAAVDPARASEVELLARLIETALAELPGDQRRRRALVAGNLSNHYANKQDFAAAERAAADAARMLREEVGAAHPYTLMARGTEARIQSTQNRHDKAIAITTEILGEVRRTYGDDHPMVAKYELGVGVYLAHAQRIDEARAAFHRALAISERFYGPDHVRVADALRKIGYLEIDRDPEAARTAFARAVAILRRAAGADGPDLAPLLAGLGDAELATGDPAAAVTTLERALAAWGDSRIEYHLVPSAKYALARALWHANRDRARARRLAEQARLEFLANKGPWAPKAEEVAAWLNTHR